MVGVNVPIPVPFAYHIHLVVGKNLFSGSQPVSARRISFLYKNKDCHVPVVYGYKRRSQFFYSNDGVNSGFCSIRRTNILYNTAREFAEEIAPNALEWEKNEEIPRELLKEAGNLGLGGMIVSEEDGGSGMSRLDGTLVFEALAMSCPSVSSFISIHNMSAWVISKRGDQKLKDKFLKTIVSLETSVHIV